MIDRLETLAKRYDELEALLSQGAAKNPREFARLAKERSGIEAVVARFRDWQRLQQDAAEAEKLAEDSDPEMRELGRSELGPLRERLQALEADLKRLLVPRDARDERSVLLEIRAGTGGEEASLFAADLFRMYSRYADGRGWKTEILSTHPSSSGGFKEVVCAIEGDAVFSRLKFESGVHRVQRVPATEAQGRIHT